VSESGFEPLTDGFSIQYSTPELLRQKYNIITLYAVKSDIFISNIIKGGFICLFKKTEEI
jgi:hypothetical protein